jgi:hypothetical protein
MSSVNEINLDELVDKETQKNMKKIKCLRCDSYILQPMSGHFKKLDEPFDLPSMKQKKELRNVASSIETEKLDRFWVVEDMFTFENVGFTNTVDMRKYLACADCEIGPIGFQNIDNPQQFLVSLDRVKHV